MINYVILKQGEEHPLSSEHLYEYLLAENGVFLRAKRKYLGACFSIARARQSLRGLSPVIESFDIDTRVPMSLTSGILLDAWRNRDQERLYYGVYKGAGYWKFLIPDQIATSMSVMPKDRYSATGNEALIELHSHGYLRAFFSSQDDADETGFKIYTVIGGLGSNKGEILTRVGIYGQYWEIPSHWVYDIKEGKLIDRASDGPELFEFSEDILPTD